MTEVGAPVTGSCGLACGFSEQTGCELTASRLRQPAGESPGRKPRLGSGDTYAPKRGGIPAALESAPALRRQRRSCVHPLTVNTDQVCCLTGGGKGGAMGDLFHSLPLELLALTWSGRITELLLPDFLCSASAGSPIKLRAQLNGDCLAWKVFVLREGNTLSLFTLTFLPPPGRPSDTQVFISPPG